MQNKSALSASRKDTINAGIGRNTHMHPLVLLYVARAHHAASGMSLEQ